MSFNINNYIYEQRRIGKSDKQIAASLGMSLKHFITKFNEETVTEAKPDIKTETETEEKTTETKPAKKQKAKESVPVVDKPVEIMEVKEAVPSEVATEETEKPEETNLEKDKYAREPWMD